MFSGGIKWENLPENKPKIPKQSEFVILLSYFLRPDKVGVVEIVLKWFNKYTKDGSCNTISGW